MSSKSRQILTSPAFLLSLSLLLLNDFYLKFAFPGLISGKLSDFAGLFAFTLFWMAVFPKFGRAISVVVSAVFILWKSSYSQPVLDIWNALQIGRISRTVDLTDLIALPVIPLAYFYGIREELRRQAPKWTAALMAVVSVFAFTATSYRTKFDYQNKYYFGGSKTDLFNKIDELHLTYFDFPLKSEEKHSGRLDLEIPSSICFGDFISAIVEVTEETGQTIVSLKELEHRCPKSSGDQERLLKEFEKEFIGRLKAGTPQTKHYERPKSAN